MSLLRNDKRNFKKRNLNPLFGGSKSQNWTSSVSPETGNKFGTDDVVSGSGALFTHGSAVEAE